MNREVSWRLPLVVIGLFVLAFLLLPAIVYVVDQREMAVVLQFGDPVAERTEPGVYFKWPLIQEVRMLPSTRQLWGGEPSDTLPDLPTKDDKKIQIVPWAIWRVKEPTVFVQRLQTLENGEQRVAQFVRSTLRDVITQYDLAELVRSTNRPMHTVTTQREDARRQPDDAREPATRAIQMQIEFGRQEILEQIKREARRRLAAGSPGTAEGRGLELIDLGISQIEFVESVKVKTFDRWIAERAAISARNVHEGERMKQEIINEAAARVQRIEGEGQRQANEVRGTVDAEVMRAYAEAIQETGEFYTLVRTLEAYQKAVGRDTHLVLTTDGDFWGLMKSLPAARARQPAKTGPPED